MQIVIGEKLYINARTGIGKDGHIIGLIEKVNRVEVVNR
jgi:hypothetical protein